MDSNNLPLGRELTVRACLTGLIIGALLAPCNIYSGLKIGWSFNMSIIALLLGFATWKLADHKRPLSVGESNLSQTAASSTASVVSGGLVAPIPALTLLTGQELSLWALSAWVFVVSFLGLWIAWYLRASLIRVSHLSFPAGQATFEAMRDIFSHGREAVVKVWTLFGAIVFSAGVKAVDAVVSITRWSPAFAFEIKSVGAVNLKNLGFSFEPSLLMFGFGAIIGPRAGISLLCGAVIAWGIIVPWGLANNYMTAGGADTFWFSQLVDWLLWPGVTLMVSYTITSLTLRVVTRLRSTESNHQIPAIDEGRGIRLCGVIVASILVVLAQHYFFQVPWLMAILAVPMAMVLAVVAAHVVGETGIPPIGAIGKVSQLSFGILAPAQISTNLLSANVAGGAAGQCADLLNDLKVGHYIGATVRLQILAQFLGLLVGSVVGSWAYLMLITDPQAQLITPEWPAPAVATWKIVAETLQHGLGAVEPSALYASAVALVVGLLLALVERVWPQSQRVLPSANALGLAMMIPASLSITMFLGSAVAALSKRVAPTWSARFVIVIASGLIAGESAAGVVQALIGIIATVQ